MSASYRRINYALRPAKAVERKMLCETFRRLHPFARIESYRYVGFGSIYFSDFYLFHRALGISDMLSIEKDQHAKECFEFNQPYKCVRMDFRPSSEVLPELEWTGPTIVWLDYDGKLNETVISDVMTVCHRAPFGSFLLVSVNVQHDREPDEPGRKQYETETGNSFDIDVYRLRKARELVGDNLPTEVTGADLRGEGVSQIARRIIKSKIDEVLTTRNRLAGIDERVKFTQLINILYNDGAKMLTYGGVFSSENEQSVIDACGFGSLDFVRQSDEPYRIEVPCLTPKEMRHLNANLPKTSAAALSMPGVPASDIAQYAEIYRFFPTFAEAVFS